MDERVVVSVFVFARARCVRARARACARTCVRACVRACVSLDASLGGSDRRRRSALFALRVSCIIMRERGRKGGSEGARERRGETEVLSEWVSE